MFQSLRTGLKSKEAVSNTEKPDMRQLTKRYSKLQVCLVCVKSGLEMDRVYCISTALWPACRNISQHNHVKAVYRRQKHRMKNFSKGPLVNNKRKMAIYYVTGCSHKISCKM